MARAEIFDSEIRIRCDYHENDLFSQLAGASHKRDKTGDYWRCPLSWAACITLRGLFGTTLDVGPRLKEWSWREWQEHIGPVMSLREALDLPADHEISHWITKVEHSQPEHLRLKGFQRTGVAFLTIGERAMLCDDMGSGKTIVAIRTLQVLQAMGKNPFPALVVCPNSLKYTVWQQELQKWAPELSATVIDGNIAQRRKQLSVSSDVKIINWELLRLHSRLAPYGATRLTDEQKTPKELNHLNHRSFLADEAHHLINVGSAKPKKTSKGDDDARVPKSQQAAAAWAVAHSAHYRFLFTGTPIADNASDLWGLEHCILPEWFPAKTRYLERFCQTAYAYWGGMEVTGLNPATEQEFRKIILPTYRRIPKEVSLPQLPPKLPVQYRSTFLSPRQKKLYDEMEKEQLAILDEETGDYVSADSQLTKLTRLMQFAAASATLDEKGKVKLAAPSSKVNDLAELLGELGTEPLVVFAVSRQLIELAAAKLTSLRIPFGLVTGAQSPVERQQAVANFQDGKLRAVMLTLAAGGEGLTLTRSNTVCFMQESFRHLENLQAVGRVDRIGAEHHSFIRIIKQVSPGTVEERKISVLAGKGERIEEILQDKQAVRRLLGGGI